MKNCYKLNLPANPLNPEHAHKILQLGSSDKRWYKSPPWHIFNDTALVQEVLRPDVFDLLTRIGLEPKLIVVFFMNKHVPADRSYVHKDIGYDNEQWKTIPFGINFEMNPSTLSTITWWDTSNCEEYYEDNDEYRTHRKDLTGLRFHPDHLRSCSKYLDLTPCEEITIKGNSTALLFRTDVAHSVATTTTDGVRFNVSLRFDNSQVTSFEEAVEKLKHLIVD